MDYKILDYYLYEGTGNRFLIIHLTNEFDKKDKKLRIYLQRLGFKKNVDSVLVLSGNPSELVSQGYHVAMDIFEPRGKDSHNKSLAGTWSTMCGNGIRAVSRYLLDEGKISCLIKTQSGVRRSQILNIGQFRVCMGSFTRARKDLRKYIASFDFKLLQKRLNKNTVGDIFAGLNGDYGDGNRIDGEPHLVVVIKQGINNLTGLINYALRFGPLITKDRNFFPEEINSNFVIKKRNKDIITACTYERGVYYVTQACGTGATVIGAHYLSENKSISSLKIRMPGGLLHIEKMKNKYYLTGPAGPIIK